MEKELIVKCFSLEEYKKVQRIGFKFGWIWVRWKYFRPQRRLVMMTGWKFYSKEATKKDPVCIRFGDEGYLTYSPLSFYEEEWLSPIKIVSAKSFIKNPAKWLKKQGKI